MANINNTMGRMENGCENQIFRSEREHLPQDEGRAGPGRRKRVLRLIWKEFVLGLRPRNV